MLKLAIISALLFKGGSTVIEREKTVPNTPSDKTHQIIQKSLNKGDLIKELETHQITCFQGSKVCCTRRPSSGEEDPLFGGTHTPILLSRDSSGAYCSEQEIDTPLKALDKNELEIKFNDLQNKDEL